MDDGDVRPLSVHIADEIRALARDLETARAEALAAGLGADVTLPLAGAIRLCRPGTCAAEVQDYQSLAEER